MKQVDIIIPLRRGDIAEVTLKSLAKQTVKDFNIIISHDTNENANAARNKGFALSTAPYILFADADLNISYDAISILIKKLNIYKAASYVYGAYKLDGQLKCNQFYNAGLLKKINFISTFSLIRREHFPGWDENIKRLQDWDLYLTMLEQKHHGVFSCKVLFETNCKPGISSPDNPLTWSMAQEIVMKKHEALCCA
jgi:glycosyltransferase involved in cell wall biosynthesis